MQRSRFSMLMRQGVVLIAASVPTGANWVASQLRDGWLALRLTGKQGVLSIVL